MAETMPSRPGGEMKSKPSKSLNAQLGHAQHDLREVGAVDLLGACTGAAPRSRPCVYSR